MMMFKTAVYHYTSKSEKRPKIYREQLQTLQDYAVSVGFDCPEIFCDMSLKKSERVQFEKILSPCDQYSALITKDYYHLSDKTMSCMKILKELLAHGVQVYTQENGRFIWEEAPLTEKLRVATYVCYFGTSNETKHIVPLKNDILTLYAQKKTQWDACIPFCVFF